MSTSCAMTQRLRNAFSDGEYCLSVNGGGTTGTRVYCHDMATDSPREYVTLPAGPDNNYSETFHTTGTRGTVRYSKLGLDLQNMYINSWDWTFVDHNAIIPYGSQVYDAYPLYGRAFSCSQEGFPRGRARIDLTGTGFHMEDTLVWQLVGHPEQITDHVRTAQTFSGECTGTCGGCVPHDGTRMTSLAYNSAELTERVMPIAYRQDLDTNQCPL